MLVIKSMHVLGLEQYAFALKKFAIDELSSTIKVPLTTVKFWKESIPDSGTFYRYSYRTKKTFIILKN